jgi:FtsP/CotA-like multicopper oxidase with cupredoxin domain
MSGRTALLYALAAATVLPQTLHSQRTFRSPLAVVDVNDNRTAGGSTSAGGLDITLTARLGRWFPDGSRRPAALAVPAFAEGDGVPRIPGPLIRVRSGTRVRVTVRNALDGVLAGAPLVMHGLPVRPGQEDTIRVEPGGSRVVSFQAGAPGTYYYWASVSDTATIDTRNGIDSQLSGAIVVDPAEGLIAGDRVFVVGRMFLPAEGQGATRQPGRFAVTINGLSWPHTERLGATVGDTIHWRWVNATDEHHPIHLHGFFFRVDAVGDGRSDTTYAAARHRSVVTERVKEGGTMAMTWVPERSGNWLIHCHLKAHSGPDASWGFPDVPGTSAFGSAFTAVAPRRPGHAAPHASGHDMERDMAGMVLGIHVRARRGQVEDPAESGSSRQRVRLTVLPHRTAPGAVPMIANRVEELGRESSASQSAGVGPAIVLRRDVPASIMVVNRLREPTALHWHGMELESYFDGVPGWTGGPGGGVGDRLSPVIMPGDSFAARMTPPKSGTFIYHSHSLSTTQVGDGLYGPLIVLEPGEAYDPTREVVWIVGGRERGDGKDAFLFLNGERHPRALSLAAGRKYRVRLINITESNTADVTLLDTSGSEPVPIEWRPLAKDAVSIGTAGQAPHAARLRTSVGETFDFELVVSRPGSLLLEVRNGGDLMVQQRVIVQ